MATRKSRAKAKAGPRFHISFHLDPERWEEIASLVLLILAALTALGAFNLSGGFLLSGWVEFLRALLGWGVYVMPLLLGGLGVWLLLDALDKTINTGWERAIGLGLGYLCLLAGLHWITSLPDVTQGPRAFDAGGWVGWAIASILAQALGVVGSALALVALGAIAAILLFNVSLAEMLSYVAQLTRRLSGAWQALVEQAQRFKLPSRAARRTPARADYTTYTPAAPPTEIEMDEGVIEQEFEPITPAPVSTPVVARAQVQAPIPAPIAYHDWHLPEVPAVLEEAPEQEISQQEIRNRVRVIEETLAHFGVPAQVREVNQGPAITQFGVEPGFIEQRGSDGQVHRVKVKVSRISALQHDLELALAAAPLRIEAPVPGRSVVGIEVPNSQIGMVSLRGVVESDAFAGIKSKLKIALGQDVAGQPICADLTTMPHLLIAGATGSGKSVCVNSIIAALLCTTTPDDVKFVMVDPKRVELVNYNAIPHLMRPVVVEVEGAVAALESAVAEMDRRYKLFEIKHARNIEIYNRMVEGNPEERLPFLLVVVDELADLMMVAASQVEHAITRLAQMARATGIHLILATQRPSVDVVTGLIKANFPARISFAVTSSVDSRVVLDTVGAEKLLGRGDMLYMASDSSKLLRLQGCYVSDRELERLVTFWKDQAPPAPPPGVEPLETGQLSQPPLWGEPAPKASSPEEDLLAEAIDVIRQNNKASVSFLQRKLRIGYARAARLMEQLEEQGLVGPDEGPTKGRSVRMPAVPAPSAVEDEDDFADWTEEDWADLDKD